MSQPFWNFSVAVYGARAVQDECLNLQDQFGLDVNLVLLCAYIGAVHGAALTADDISSARQEVGEWHEDVVRTLRAARRSLKTIDLGHDAQAVNAAMSLRTQVKAAELEAERIEQTKLEQWANARLAAWPRGNSRDAALANLQTLLAACGISRERLIAATAMKHLIAAALDRASDSQRPPQ
jgi:uncharacterized protein (TIGR02444 family)